MNPRQVAVKRATDLVLTLLGCLAVRLTSRSPGFFRQ
jgi:hypothetical protein